MKSKIKAKSYRLETQFISQSTLIRLFYFRYIGKKDRYKQVVKNKKENIINSGSSYATCTVNTWILHVLHAELSAKSKKIC